MSSFIIVLLHSNTIDLFFLHFLLYSKDPKSLGIDVLMVETYDENVVLLFHIIML